MTTILIICVTIIIFILCLVIGYSLYKINSVLNNSIEKITSTSNDLILLTNEINKRLVYIVTDVMQSIDLSTNHLDTLGEEPMNINDIIKPEKNENYFNPHEFDVDEYKENE